MIEKDARHRFSSPVFEWVASANVATGELVPVILGSCQPIILTKMATDKQHSALNPTDVADILTAHYLLIGFAFGSIYRLDRSLFEELKQKATETAALAEKSSPGNACSKEILRLLDEFKEPQTLSFSVIQGGKPAGDRTDESI